MRGERARKALGPSAELIGAPVALETAIRTQQYNGQQRIYNSPAARSAHLSTSTVPAKMFEMSAGDAHLLPRLNKNLDRATHGVVDDLEHDRANHRDKNAVQVQARDACVAKHTEQPAANHGPNDAEKDVEQDTFARPVDDLAADEPSDESQADPRQKCHKRLR